MIWTHLVYYLLLFALLLAGLFVSVLGLPGLWLMVASAAGYAWLTAGSYIGKWALITIFALALAAEFVELLAGSVGARKAGGSRRATLGAIVGALLGGIFLSLIPIPVVSTIVGACLGAFIGAAAAEFTGHGDVELSMRVGAGAAQGRFYGILAKLAFGLAIALTVLIAGFPHSRSSTIPAPASSPPATTNTSG